MIRKYILDINVLNVNILWGTWFRATSIFFPVFSCIPSIKTTQASALRRSVSQSLAPMFYILFDFTQLWLQLHESISSETPLSYEVGLYVPWHMYKNVRS